MPLLARFLRFAAVGVIGFVVNAGLVEAMARVYDPVVAQAIAFPVAVSVTWWLNRRFTFGPSGHALHREWLRYVAANAGGWLANNGTYYSLILSLAWVYGHPVVAVAAGSLSGMFINFFASHYLVFGAQRGANKKVSHE